MFADGGAGCNQISEGLRAEIQTFALSTDIWMEIRPTLAIRVHCCVKMWLHFAVAGPLKTTLGLQLDRSCSALLTDCPPMLSQVQL